jgi:hypothetical protein
MSKRRYSQSSNASANAALTALSPLPLAFAAQGSRPGRRSASIATGLTAVFPSAIRRSSGPPGWACCRLRSAIRADSRRWLPHR